MRAQRRSIRALFLAGCLALTAAGTAHAFNRELECFIASGKSDFDRAPRLGSSFGVQCDATADFTFAYIDCLDGDHFECQGDYRATADGRGIVCFDSPTFISTTPQYCPASGGGGGGGGGGCALALGGPQETFTFRLDGDPVAAPLPKSSFVLNRMERGEDEITSLMDEWAVIRTSLRPGETTPTLTVVKASSPAFAAAKLKDLSVGAGTLEKRRRRSDEESSGTLLIVEAPIHPHNSRYAPTPSVKLSGFEVPPGMPARTLLVRADFTGKSDSPRWLQLLHSDGPVSKEMKELVASRLALDHTSVARHRTIVFATITIGDVLELKPLATVTPKCCCGDWFCD